MLRGTFRGLVLAGALVVSSIAGTPAMAGPGDGEPQAGKALGMVIIAPQNDGTAIATAIRVDVENKKWHRMVGLTGTYSPQTETEGDLSEATLAEIQDLAASPDLAVEQKLPEIPDGVGFLFYMTKKQFMVFVGESKFMRIVLDEPAQGDGYPAGDDAFVKLVKLLNEKTA